MRILLPSILVVLFVFVPSVFAQDSADATPTVRPGLQRIRDAQPTIEARREEMTAKREELKAQYRVQLEERRRLIVERIQTNLTAINERRTAHFVRILERLKQILERIVSRSDKLKEEGEDVSTVENAVQTAQSAINEALSEVTAQEQKTYQIVISDEEAVRAEAGKTASGLQTDLKAVRDAVFAAREAVHDALLALIAVHRSANPDAALSAVPTITE